MVGMVGKQEDLIKIFQLCRPAQIQHLVYIGFWLILQYWIKKDLVYMCQMNPSTFFVGYLFKKIIIIFVSNCFMILVLFVSSLDSFNLTIFLTKWECFFPRENFPLQSFSTQKISGQPYKKDLVVHVAYA